jgi:hypothetical protein
VGLAVMPPPGAHALARNAKSNAAASPRPPTAAHSLRERAMLA